MNYDDALEYSPTESEARHELEKHGAEWSELLEYCHKYDLEWSEPSVLLGFLGY